MKKKLKNKNILAIIPARGGSKGLKNKNIRKLNKKPLIYWISSEAKKSKYINKIIVSTDSKKIRNVCNSLKIDTPFLRPRSISKDTSTSIELIIHAINFFKKKKEKFDYVVLLEPTSPLTTCKDIDLAIETLFKKKNIADSIVGISENVNRHPSFNIKVNHKGIIQPLEKKFSIVRRQRLKKLFFFDGSLYISTVEKLLESRSFYHNRTLGYKTDKWKSIEIDDIVDFLIAETLLKNKNKIESNLNG
jgi:CMP-N,N'-diacetyllegionaminic acid synthase